ncbi:calcium uniporter protein 4 mitochondrial [Prunus yedoensis var. nudiflora]|uniref:Calcium uniporter protein 4 mitochondrial n=1 Tax=Prunus yedoensis var. nudiflora TaxID=2094558 RepID=A0A314XNE6_PRUYE|nr:calcium uniporter protein 4 mitochondrial [Prunus yedoensis var. nudiflora]
MQKQEELDFQEQKCHEINNEHKDLEFLTVLVGEKLLKKLRGINISVDRLQLSGLNPPPPDLVTANDALYEVTATLPSQPWTQERERTESPRLMR